jgi:hypothetical protein
MQIIQSHSYVLDNCEFGELYLQAKNMYGDISPYHLSRSLGVIYSCLTKYPRVCAMRVDLRFAEDSWGGEPDLPTCFQRTDQKVITRFFESLKSQLREEHRRKGMMGDVALPDYIWVKEQDDSHYPHYHLVLLFNKDFYAYLGNYQDHDAQNMANRIKKAWCSALGLDFPEYATLVHFPRNPTYIISRKDATIHSESYRGFLLRVAYLAKARTKCTVDGQRSFGCSQI